MTKSMTNRLSWEDYQRIKDIKILDLEWCEFCCRLNILNLGWKPFKKLYCLTDNREHVLCQELCYKVALNILGCELYRKEQQKQRRIINTNQSYYKSRCYLCGKELKGAGKTGVIKNRNNSTFWGLREKFISCLGCLGKKYYGRLEKGKKKTLKKYVKRGYI